jgi:hypothetical protein
MSFKEWPGVGDEPEPEPEGFREEQIEAERQRQEDVAKEQAERNKDTKAFYSGESDTPPGTTHKGRSGSTTHKHTSTDEPKTTTYSSKSSKH